MDGQSFNWGAAWRAGRELSKDRERSGVQVNDSTIMWALLCEAAQVSRFYEGPPRSGYPTKSAWPDTPDEVTFWQKLSAYLSGELSEMPQDEMPRIQPSAEQISRADAVLHVWAHGTTLGIKKKKAVYIKALGKPNGLITRVTGLTAQEAKNAKRRAVSEMLSFIAKRY